MGGVAIEAAEPVAMSSGSFDAVIEKIEQSPPEVAVPEPSGHYVDDDGLPAILRHYRIGRRRRIAPGVSLRPIELSGNGTGLWIQPDTGVAAGIIRNSLILGNSGDGIVSQASQVYLTVETSTINANVGVGIHTLSAGSNINVFSSTIGANGTGVLATSGSIVSFGNNGLNGNATNGTFTSTVVLK